jgi:hypothetical protein
MTFKYGVELSPPDVFKLKEIFVFLEVLTFYKVCCSIVIAPIEIYLLSLSLLSFGQLSQCQKILIHLPKNFNIEDGGQLHDYK